MTRSRRTGTSNQCKSCNGIRVLLSCSYIRETHLWHTTCGEYIPAKLESAVDVIGATKLCYISCCTARHMNKREGSQLTCWVKEDMILGICYPTPLPSHTHFGSSMTHADSKIQSDGSVPQWNRLPNCESSQTTGEGNDTATQNAKQQPQPMPLMQCAMSPLLQ